jgi:predicted ATP-dependent serine protease
MAMNIGTSSNGIKPLGEIEIPVSYFNRFGTGVAAIDNMFGDGFIAGQVITLSSARGVGKSTALLQILEGVIKNNPDKKCLYLSGEEYIAQLAFTAKRISTPSVLADNITDVDQIAQMTKDYDIIVIDSMATLTCKNSNKRNAIESYAMNTIYKAAKDNECVVIFILHQTKDGKSMGKSSIEHTCDTCIKIFNVDSEEYGELNVKAFCVDKNRFGMTKDLIVRMTSKGWDFDNPIREDYNKDKSKNSIREEKAQTEIGKILELRRFQMNDLKSISDDMKVLSRLSRRVNDLVKTGILKKVGRGASSVYSVKKES